MKMSRARFNELIEAQVEPPTLGVWGPQESIRRFCQTGAPLTLEGCGFLTDNSPWVHERIVVEPGKHRLDWRSYDDRLAVYFRSDGNLVDWWGRTVAQVNQVLDVGGVWMPNDD